MKKQKRPVPLAPPMSPEMLAQCQAFDRRSREKPEPPPRTIYYRKVETVVPERTVVIPTAGVVIQHENRRTLSAEDILGRE